MTVVNSRDIAKNCIFQGSCSLAEPVIAGVPRRVAVANLLGNEGQTREREIEVNNQLLFAPPDLKSSLATSHCTFQ